MHLNTNPHTHSSTDSDTHTLTHTYTHIQTHTHTHSSTDSDTHTHSHTHTHTHTHMHHYTNPIKIWWLIKIHFISSGCMKLYNFSCRSYIIESGKVAETTCVVKFEWFSWG